MSKEIYRSKNSSAFSRDSPTLDGAAAVLYFSQLGDEIEEIKAQYDSGRFNREILDMAYSQIAHSWSAAYNELSDGEGEFRDCDVDVETLHEYASVEKQLNDLDKEYEFEEGTGYSPISEVIDRVEDPEFVNYLSEEFK